MFTVFFLKKCITFLLSMEISFFCLVRHDKYCKIDCLSMVIFCHFDLNRIYCYIVQIGYTS